MRRPLSEVLAWPESHVRLQLAFLAKEPAAEDRIEIAVAQLAALVFNRSRSSEDEDPLSLTDFLPFADPWRPVEPASPGLSSYELQMLNRHNPQP